MSFVFFHAHPDDEAIATGGTMRKAAEAGRRVVLVTATRGELGEPVPGVLADGEELWQRRVVETAAAAEALGAARQEFLGYRDSGMMGEPTNAEPACFWMADLDEAAGRLADLLKEEQAEVLTVYDDHGGYGHPDHINVHRVGLRAAELAGVPFVYESTMDRDRIRLLMAEQAAALAEAGPGESAGGEAGGGEEGTRPAPPEGPPDLDTFGSPAGLITTRVDVTAQIGAKRAAMLAHRSQIADDSFFLTMPDEVFLVAFGEEVYIRHGDVPGPLDRL